MQKNLVRLVLAGAVALVGCGGGGGDSPAVDAGADVYVPPAISKPFPADFLWGTATAAYQVEKGLDGTDWHQWEQKGKVIDGDKSGAPDRANDGPEMERFYEADLERAKSLGNNTYRFEMAMARLFPTRAALTSATPDPAALTYYRALLAACKARGIVPMVTLHHFVWPTWIHDVDDVATKGGWASESTITDFTNFATWSAKTFGADVDLWVTINEPMVYVINGYLGGQFPPGNFLQVEKALTVAYNMIEGHARAYDAIHANDTMDADGDGKPALVSIANHNRVMQPKNPADAMDRRAAELLQKLSNRVFFDAATGGNIDKNFDGDYDDPGDKKADPRLMNRMDYLGVNYYGLAVVQYIGNENSFPVIGIPRFELLETPWDKTEFNWDIYPQGLREVLDEMKGYQLPIYITENGIADRDEEQRSRFLVEHLYELQRAMADGIDVRGYYPWSLVDNFEWSAGYCPRFGLYAVDFSKPDKPRSEGAAARLYKRIIAERTVSPDLFRTLPPYPLQLYEESCPVLSPL